MVWHEQRTIYDYGVLIKIEDTITDQGGVARPLVSALYDEKARMRSQGWKDPFVHGPQ